MKYAVLDACFPIDRQGSVGMAAMWIKWKLQKLGGFITIPQDASVILVSVVDPRQNNYISRVKKLFPLAKIYVGGAGALSPYSLGIYADAVCVGNGDRFLEVLVNQSPNAVSLLPESWIHGEDRLIEVADGFCWDCPPIQTEDGAFRVWCGRGCKKKCYFCQTGWGTKYEENPHPYKLLQQIKSIEKRGDKFAYLSNDPLQHSFYSMLPDVGHGSFSIEYLRKKGVPNARQVRIGVEGISERLRSLVGKPLGKNDLVNATVWLNENKKSVRWFLIAGLPGENKDDWEELRESITEWKMKCQKGVLALSFTAWQPEPASPMAILPLDDLYQSNFENFSEWFFGGVGWSNRIKIMKPAQPKTRLASSMSRMGLSEEELRVGGNWGPNDRVNYPYKKAAQKIGKRLYKNQY